MGLAAADGASSRLGCLAVEGYTNTGATMPVTQPATGGNRCCGGSGCVNIYVNSNVQGVTSSVLLGSKVVMRDPGARLSIRRLLKQEQKKAALKKTGIVAILLLAASTAVGFASCF